MAFGDPPTKEQLERMLASYASEADVERLAKDSVWIRMKNLLRKERKVVELSWADFHYLMHCAHVDGNAEGDLVRAGFSFWPGEHLEAQQQMETELAALRED